MKSMIWLLSIKQLRDIGCLCLGISMLIAVFSCGRTAQIQPGDTVFNCELGSGGIEMLEARLPYQNTSLCRPVRAGKTQTLSELVPCYREIAETIVLEWMALNALTSDAELDQVADQVMGEYTSRHPDELVQMVLSAHIKRLESQITPNEEELKRRYNDHPERYKRQGVMSLWNIYRRHEDPNQPQQTLDFLAEIKQHFLNGESFENLARQYSHSETRARGGLVGTRIKEGRLPLELERIAFALEDGAVSEPVLVAGGAVLLHVRRKIPASDLSFEDASIRVARRMKRKELEQLFNERLADSRDLADAVILSDEDLIHRLNHGEGEDIVLQIGTLVMTVNDLRERARFIPEQKDEATKNELVALMYRQQVRARSLYM